ncbi:hypothetical protein SAMN04488057_11437 [Cyclobacterium lianum]|uniref:NnrS protein n=1 Tax=Cyclobacterium lianum TaxID=388280 RepID=A0A1M7Q600_9BACT|nr:hypothetical protein [Cyclobacterium lianum]SHN25565.1 hypothetical protein SAMN04488057_11437 [Cyclobacterium lianum]
MKSIKLIHPAWLLPVILGCLIMGIVGGWIRLGYLAFPIPEAAAHHGLLMVGGFLGALISLERAMVMKHRAWLLVPLLAVLSLPLLLGGWPMAGSALLLAASTCLVVLMYIQTLRLSEIHTYIIALGAAAWMLGNFAWIYSGFVPMATGWWMAFLLFTILGERVELNRFLPTPEWAKGIFIAGMVLFGLGLLLPFHQWGNSTLGFASVLLAFWLLRFDMARKAAGKPGQFRYTGIGLLTGYLWLALHGLILAWMENHPYYYDLYLHTFFLGFTFSMIWAHAPIIIPAVFKVHANIFHPVLWLGWSLFQLSLAGRMIAAWQEDTYWRKLFGILNGWTILLMFMMMATVLLVRVTGGKSGKAAALPGTSKTVAG